MRNDEIPIFLVKQSEALEKLYPRIGVRDSQINDMTRRDVTNEGPKSSVGVLSGGNRTICG